MNRLLAATFAAAVMLVCQRAEAYLIIDEFIEPSGGQAVQSFFSGAPAGNHGLGTPANLLGTSREIYAKGSPTSMTTATINSGGNGVLFENTLQSGDSILITYDGHSDFVAPTGFPQQTLAANVGVPGDVGSSSTINPIGLGGIDLRPALDDFYFGMHGVVAGIPNGATATATITVYAYDSGNNTAGAKYAQATVNLPDDINNNLVLVHYDNDFSFFGGFATGDYSSVGAITVAFAGQLTSLNVENFASTNPEPASLLAWVLIGSVTAAFGLRRRFRFGHQPSFASS